MTRHNILSLIASPVWLKLKRSFGTGLVSDAGTNGRRRAKASRSSALSAKAPTGISRASTKGRRDVGQRGARGHPSAASRYTGKVKTSTATPTRTTVLSFSPKLIAIQFIVPPLHEGETRAMLSNDPDKWLLTCPGCFLALIEKAAELLGSLNMRRGLGVNQREFVSGPEKTASRTIEGLK